MSGLILVLFTYPLVNQTVAQRIVSAHSEIDARKGSIVSLLPWFFVTGVAVLAGVIGTVLVPGLAEENRNELFPMYMTMYLNPGLLGLGVAALVVGSMSTGAGIGTAISGLLTNDVFRMMNSEKYTEAQRLMWARIFATIAIVLGSLLSMKVKDFGGMVPFYVTFSGTFVLPLTVPYLATAFFPAASRHSALASLIAGCMVGLVLFLVDGLPEYMTQAQCRPIWVLGTSLVVMVIWSIVENSIKGRIPREELASRLNTFEFGRSMTGEELKELVESGDIKPWEAQKNIDYSKLGIQKGIAWYSRPGLFETIALVFLISIMIWLW